MRTTTLLTVLAAGLVLGSLTGASAKEYNQRQHLAPGQQSKVNSVIAGSRRGDQAGANRFGRVTNTSCGDLNIGPSNTNSKRPPREVIIVARDIINVAKNC